MNTIWWWPVRTCKKNFKYLFEWVKHMQDKQNKMKISIKELREVQIHPKSYDDI